MAQTAIRRFAPGFNRVQLQMADAEARLPGGIFSGFTKIGYSAKNAVEEARSNSILPQGVTRGNLSYEASLAINRSERDSFRIAATVAGRGMFEGFFPLIISWSHPEWDHVESDTLYLKVTEWNFDSSSGPAVLGMDISVYCGFIEFGSGGKVIPQFADIIGTTG